MACRNFLSFHKFPFRFFDGFLCRAEASKSDIASLGYFALVARMLDCSSCVQLCVTPWTVALQTPLSIGFSRQEYWSGLPCPPPEDLPDPGIEPRSLTSPALAGRFFTTSTTWEAWNSCGMKKSNVSE